LVSRGQDFRRNIVVQLDRRRYRENAPPARQQAPHVGIILDAGLIYEEMFIRVVFNDL